MSVHVEPFVAEDEQECARWDEFVANSWNGCFLHSRRFLSHYGKKFQDCSLWLKDGKGRPVGVFPAAETTDGGRMVCSHPGATFGGICHAGGMCGGRILEAFDALADHYRSLDYRKIRYKLVPAIYHRRPVADDTYALFLADAVLWRRHLSVVVPPTGALVPSQRRRRGLRKALLAKVKVSVGNPRSPYASPLWEVIKDNLAARQLSPAHSDEEIFDVARRFPDEITFVAALLDEKVVGGVICWRYPTVLRAQYIGSNETGRRHSVLDAVFVQCIEQARKDFLWFSFGASNRADNTLVDSLYGFKLEFGGGGMPLDIYDISL